MSEAIRKGMGNAMTISSMEAQDTVNKGVGQANVITQAFNGATQVAQSAISAYAQSEMRKDAPKFMKGLEQLADEYADPDKPNAYQDFISARDNYIGNYLKDKNLIFRGMFNQQYRAKYEDDAYTYFDKKFLSNVSDRNLLNATQIMNDSIDTFTDGEDLSKYDNPIIYKTVVDETGIRVVQEAVELDNLWDTSLPTDTDDDELNERNRKQNEFNHLLNIQYEAAALAGMTTDRAKLYAEEQKASIESKAMTNDIYNMAQVYSQGMKMPDGTVRHYTADETKAIMHRQYEAGIPTPYTGRELSQSESASYKKIVDSVVDSAYTEIYARNAKRLVNDEDGIFADAVATGMPLTSDVLYQYLQDSEMIELNDDGTVKSWYGLDDNTWTELEKIAKNNDRIYQSELIISDKTYWGEDGVLDYTDFPAELQGYVVRDANKIWQVSAKEKYMTLKDTYYAQSTVDAMNAGMNVEETAMGLINSLSEFIGWDYNGSDPPADNGVLKLYQQKMVERYGQDWESQDIGDYQKEVVKTEAYAEAYRELSHYLALADDATLNKYFSALSDRYKDIAKGMIATTSANAVIEEYNKAIEDVTGLISANKAYELFGDTSQLIEQARAEGELTEDKEANLDLVAKEQYEKNNIAIDDSSKKWYETAGYESANNFRAFLESPYIYSKLVATQMLKDEVANTYNTYVADCENIVMFAANGYNITSDYQYEATGARTANMVFDISNKNLRISAKAYLRNMDDEKRKVYDGIDFDNLVTEEERAEIGKKYTNEAERDFQINQLEHARLTSFIQEMSGTDALTVSVMFNSNAVTKVQDNLKNAYNDFQRDTKADYRYDSDVITVPSWTDVTNAVNENIANSVSKYGDFKVATSANGVLTGYMNRILAGDDVNYLKELAKADPLLSESDTDKFLGMSNSAIFKELSGNPDVTNTITEFIKGFDNQITQSYAWDAMYRVLADAYKDGKIEDLPTLVEKAKNAFAMSYGEKLPDSMFEYDENSSVYGTPKFGNKHGKESDATKEKINENVGAFWNGALYMSGINSIVNDYINTQDNITLLRVQVDKLAGNDDRMDAYCVWLALDALGEPVERYNIDYDSESFWDELPKYFGRLSKNDKSFDAVYADHILKVAGAFKASFSLYDKSSIDSVGEIVYGDYEKNIYQTTALTDSAVRSGTYISFSETGSPILQIGDGEGNHTAFDISFTTEDGRKAIAEQILKEVNDSAYSNTNFSNIYGVLNNPLAKGDNFDTVNRLLDSTCQALAEASPTYREYLLKCRQASKYMQLPDKVGKAWFNNGSIQFEFVDGDILNTSTKKTDTFSLFDEVRSDAESRNGNSVQFDINNTKTLSSQQRESNAAIVDYMNGLVRPQNPSTMPADLWGTAGIPRI